jgi:uncharacterized repeat protein (TIGR01451 family)
MKTKNMNKIIVILMLFISSLGYGQMDPSIIWQKNYGGNAEEVAYDMILTSKNKLVFVGYSMSSDIDLDTNYGGKDVWVAMLDINGNMLWSKTIGNTLNNYSSKVVENTDGTILLNTISYDYFPPYKSSVLRIDTLGNILNELGIKDSSNERVNDICVAKDSTIYILSYLRTERTSLPLTNFRITKLDNNFNYISDSLYPYIYTEFDLPKNIIEINQNNFLITFTTSYTNIASINIDTSLQIIDTSFYTINTSTSDINGVILSNNQIYLVGSTDAGNEIFTGRNLGSYDGYLIRTDINNNIINNLNYGGSDYDHITSINKSINNNLILSGWTNSLNHDIYENNGQVDGWLIEVDSIGNKIWSKNYGSSGVEQFYKILSDGTNYYAVGSVYGGRDQDCTVNYDTIDVWLIKIKRPTHVIKGNVFADFNLDCDKDTISEIGIRNILINNIHTNENIITNNNGDYYITTYTDTLGLSLAYLPTYLINTCFSSDSIYIYFDSTSSSDSSGIDIPLESDMCYNLFVYVNQSVVNRLCFYSIFNIDFSNQGFDTARSSFIIIEIDTAVFDSINSVYPYTLSGDTIRFDLGDIAPFEYNTISFTAHVKCSATTGTSACTRAYIYPLSNCPPPIVDYDSSDIEVMTRCSNDTVHVEVKNRVGAQDMTSPGRIVAIEDEIIQQAEPFILNAGLSVNYDYYVNPDRTLTIKVEQSPNHPTRPIIILHDELCALTAPIKLNSVINHFSRYDDANEYEEVCTRIIGSYDPNIKSVVPQGFTSQHYTDSNQILEYRIDFQNTGLDTARRVVIVDTLSQWLNVNTFVPLVASHTYTTQIIGSNIIHFIFDPIALPDSNVSVPNSQGYVTFKIRPKFNTPKGTVINNFAEIFFDFNAPIRTNTVFNTIYDTVLVRLGLGLNEPKENLEAHILVFPNPTVDKFFVKLDNDILGAQIKLLDINGREVYQMNNVNGREIEMKANNLTQGIYFIQIYDKNKLIGRSKIIVQ